MAQPRSGVDPPWIRVVTICSNRNRNECAPQRLVAAACLVGSAILVSVSVNTWESSMERVRSGMVKGGFVCVGEA